MKLGDIKMRTKLIGLFLLVGMTLMNGPNITHRGDLFLLAD